ncbi:MAG: type IV secretory system conjugative DNA transfer family protein [Bacilli bacterium]|nr:type IV secretory system conjugative DNA transfer family protein [Bacilli bacterium]
MNQTRWATKKEMKEALKEVTGKEEIEVSGIPIMHDKEKLYIDSREAHNLIIGSTGSGKTQSIILPMIKFAIQAQESILINDPTGTIYERVAKKFKKENYKVIAINFDNPTLGDSWNPLEVSYKLYKQDNIDKALDSIEELGYYLFYEKEYKETDPFWINSTINYFTGLVLYLFENAKEEEINLSSVVSLANTLNDKGSSAKFIEKLDKNSTILLKVAGTLKAPPETRGSILSVFNLKIEKYITRKNLENMLMKSNFDITKILEEKTAIFLISGINAQSGNLISLFINQIMDIVSIYGKNRKRFNILLDEFDSITPIKDLSRKLTHMRSFNIRVTATIQSYVHLLNMYPKEETEILKMCFGNLIYLLSEDTYTLEEISKSCGMITENNKEYPLMPISELKTMKSFEAIVFMTRMLPFKTTLLPNYKIDWGYEEEEESLSEREKNTLHIYQEEF